MIVVRTVADSASESEFDSKVEPDTREFASPGREQHASEAIRFTFFSRTLRQTRITRSTGDTRGLKTRRPASSTMSSSVYCTRSSPCRSWRTGRYKPDLTAHLPTLALAEKSGRLT